jgi:hypothetical protein
VISNLYRRQLDEGELEAELDLFCHNAWFGQPLLRRLMRRYWKRGKTSVDNQIVLDTQCYSGTRSRRRQGLARCDELDTQASAGDSAQRQR